MNRRRPVRRGARQSFERLSGPARVAVPSDNRFGHRQIPAGSYSHATRLYNSRQYPGAAESRPSVSKAATATVHGKQWHQPPMRRSAQVASPSRPTPLTQSMAQHIPPKYNFDHRQSREGGAQTTRQAWQASGRSDLQRQRQQQQIPDQRQQRQKQQQVWPCNAAGGSPVPPPTLLAPTVPNPDAFPFLRDVFGPCDARPQTACIVGKNFTCCKQMHPTRQTICKTFGKWQTFIYLPNGCQFAYLPVNLFFCATPFAGSSNSSVGGTGNDSVELQQGITGVLCYQWLFNRQCGCNDECDASDSDIEQETVQSIMRLNDVDAPSFFVENSSSESSQYSENRSADAVRSVAELRPLDLTLRPDIQVCDTDLEGSLLAVVFSLTSVNCSPRYSFLWQIQIGNIGSMMPQTVDSLKINRLQTP